MNDLDHCSIAIIEDESTLGDLIKEVLVIDGYAQVHHFSDGLLGWEFCKANDPDLVILDLKLPSLHGMEILKRISSGKLKAKVMILSGSLDQRLFKEALEYNARGIAEKTTPLSEIRSGIKVILEGKTFYGSSILDRMNELMEDPTPSSRQLSALTNTEVQVLQFVAEGYSSKEIAGKLSSQPRTIDTHRNNLVKKLGVKGIAGLTQLAIREGLIGT